MLLYINLAITFAIALGIGLAIPALLVLLYNRYVIGLVLVLSTFVIEAVVVQYPAIRLGIIIYPEDFVFILIGVAAILRIISRKEIPFHMGLWLGLGTLLIFSLIRGLASHGTAAGVDFRGNYYFWSSSLYFMTFTYGRRDLDRVLRWWLMAASGMLAVTIFRWISDALDMQILPFGLTFADIGGAGVPFRVINAGQTYMLAVAAVLVVAMIGGLLEKRQVVWQFMLPLFLLAILVLQHRTVWMATFVTLMVLFYLERRRFGQVAGYVGIAGILSIAVLLPLMVTGKMDNVAQAVGQSATNALSTQTGTFVGRVEGWGALLEQWRAYSIIEKIVGKPYGSGYTRVVGTEEVEYSPHNFYVELLLRIGVVGVVVLLWMYATVLRTLLTLNAREQSSRLPYSLFFSLLIGQLVFFIPYGAIYLDGIIFGMSVGLGAWTQVAVTEDRTIKASA